MLSLTIYNEGNSFKTFKSTEILSEINDKVKNGVS